MRHRVSGRKLGRKTAHRLMMFRNLVTSLLDKERIRTTLPRAKEIRPIAERMITLGKRENLHARRQALAFIKDPAVVGKLFETLAPRFSQRPGGYTRIIRLGFRDGDGAQMAIIELLGSEFKPAKGEEGKTQRKVKKAAKAEAPEETKAAPEKEEAPKKEKAKAPKKVKAKAPKADADKAPKKEKPARKRKTTGEK
jgi:large subunit ribosomal protein L17